MKAIDHLVTGSKSECIRDAIQEKLRRERDRLLEKHWIEALQVHSDTTPADDDWLAVEAWESK